MALKKKQGDSLWVDVTGSAMTTVDATWANWTGTWAIVPAIGGTPELSGTMTKDATEIGKFYVRIGASQMAILAVGTHYLVCQVTNSTVDYVQEVVQEKLTIITQGIA